MPSIVTIASPAREIDSLQPSLEAGVSVVASSVSVASSVVGSAVVGSSVGTSVSGSAVVGSSVGTSVVGSSVVGTSVVGTSVVGTSVVGSSVVGTSVVGASVVGASVPGVTPGEVLQLLCNHKRNMFRLQTRALRERLLLHILYIRSSGKYCHRSILLSSCGSSYP